MKKVSKDYILVISFFMNKRIIVIYEVWGRKGKKNTLVDNLLLASDFGGGVFIGI